MRENHDHSHGGHHNPGGSYRYEDGIQQNTGGSFTYDDHKYSGAPLVHDDENSTTSDPIDPNDFHAASGYQTPRQRQTTNHSRRSHQQYAQNAFVYLKGTMPQYIREDKASTTGRAFTAHLGSNEDPREFYKEVRQ